MCPHLEGRPPEAPPRDQHVRAAVPPEPLIPHLPRIPSVETLPPPRSCSAEGGGRSCTRRASTLKGTPWRGHRSRYRGTPKRSPDRDVALGFIQPRSCTNFAVAQGSEGQTLGLNYHIAIYPERPGERDARGWPFSRNDRAAGSKERGGSDCARPTSSGHLPIRAHPSLASASAP